MSEQPQMNITGALSPYRKIVDQGAESTSHHSSYIFAYGTTHINDNRRRRAGFLMLTGRTTLFICSLRGPSKTLEPIADGRRGRECASNDHSRSNRVHLGTSAQPHILLWSTYIGCGCNEQGPPQMSTASSGGSVSIRRGSVCRRRTPGPSLAP